ncbi:MAG: endonuclease/exonuclease/phosphatase family protein [Clostridia bacterium]|nr:endonuclease/exonuclease/phosphatase family protein [Clostridia bacterium]
MKVMTFNIQHCLDYKNNRINISLFSDTIKKYGADICGLNEVRGKGPLLGYSDQTRALGDSLKFNSYFAEAIKVKGKSPYGNALVTRYEIISCVTIPVPDPTDKSDKGSFETRCILNALLNVDNQKLRVLVCHMGLEASERVNAVKIICNLLDEITDPVILMGDFNSTPDDTVYAPLYDRLSDADVLSVNKGMATYPSYAPDKKIDYIFYRGLKCKDVETICEIISDHYPIIAEFEFLKNTD